MMNSEGSSVIAHFRCPIPINVPRAVLSLSDIFCSRPALFPSLSDIFCSAPPFSVAESVVLEFYLLPRFAHFSLNSFCGFGFNNFEGRFGLMCSFLFGYWCALSYLLPRVDQLLLFSFCRFIFDNFEAQFGWMRWSLFGYWWIRSAFVIAMIVFLIIPPGVSVFPSVKKKKRFFTEPSQSIVIVMMLAFFSFFLYVWRWIDW